MNSVGNNYAELVGPFKPSSPNTLTKLVDTEHSFIPAVCKYGHNDK